MFSKEKRSEVMSRIRAKDTKPEVVVRSLLHRLGYRFTVNGPKNRSLQGKPDIVLPKYGTVIFVNGCFWHRHRGCKYAYTPKTRVSWWLKKLGSNVARDKAAAKKLRQSGWQVVTIWECQLRSKAKLNRVELKLTKALQVPCSRTERKHVLICPQIRQRAAAARWEK